MSRLVSFFTNAAEDHPLTPVVESHPLNELRPAVAMHTYPPQPPAPASLDSCPSVTMSSTEFAMVLFDNASETARRKRDDDDQQPNKIFLKEVDQSSRLRDDVRELQFSKHDLLLRKRQIQITANSRESELQSVITQYQEHQELLERSNADALASLNDNHHKELAEFQNRMTLGLHEAQKEARIERDTLLAEKDALFQYEARVTREKLLAEKEAELARFSSEHSSKIASLDSQMQQANTTRSIPSPAWRHLVGKRPVATCTNIVGFSIISDASSESDGDEEPQIGIGGNAAPLLTSLLADVPIQNATVGMLVEALAKVLQIPSQTMPPRATQLKCKTHKPPVENFTDAQRRNNKANVRELFHIAFHFVKDDEFMLHETASREAILSFMYGSSMGPNPLELQWDMTTTHNSEWNQKSVMDNITSKFNQCRKCWRKVQPRVLSDGIRETIQEIGDRLVDQTNERLWLTRVHTRRATKFETRKKVTSALLSDRIATGKDDQAVWAYLQSLVETLGKDGMSSDESEHKGGEAQVFRLKKMPWRAEVRHEMHIIDQQRLAGATNFTPRGSKPAKCFCNANRESSRQAIEGLPRALYNPSWLNKQPPSFTVSDKKFQRMDIIVSHQ
ncbi:hypothetical protein DFH29DRAFT_993300 [Suillus ampliporus]|nr:hypothetical protein DFH29DRAFT_993300 [Suillus ampliporus]